MGLQLEIEIGETLGGYLDNCSKNLRNVHIFVSNSSTSLFVS